MTRPLFAVLAALSLCACVAVKEPVGTSVGYANDPALEGLWTGKPGKDKPPGYYHVILNDDATMTVVGVAPRSGDDKASWGTLALTTAKLGPNRYMNLRETSEDGAPPKDMHAPDESIPLYYTVDGDTLTVFSLDEDKVKAAIRSGRVEGTITVNKVGPASYDSVAITADGPHLDALLAARDAPALFEQAMTLKKVAP